MGSRRWVVALALGALASAGCTATPSSVESTTSVPPAEVSSRAVATVATVPISAAPEPTGVPGLSAADPFCAAWAGYVGTVQALGVAASFGDLSSDRFAALELVAAPRLAEVAAAIDALWPPELASEHDIVIEQRIGPYARRASKGLDALSAAGLIAADLTTLSSVWQTALSARNQDVPVIVLPPLADDLQGKVDTAATAFNKAMTPFAQDPSLVVDAVDTPLTDAYLVAHCPDLASSGVGDAV